MKVKQTNDGKKGGLLKGKPHYDKDGNSLGGIKAVVSDSGNRPVELEGGEVIINKEASKKHWKLLSKINQSAGGGVPIGPPSGADFDEDPEEFKEGGRIIEFNPNHVPNKWVVQYAEKIKKENPEIWKLGGNIFGNQAFENLLRVSKRGHWLDSEEWMYIKWRSYVARHKGDFRIEGVVAMLKWCDKVEKGWAYMKDLIEEKIDKIESKKEKATSKMATGGGVEKENDTAKSLRERYRKLWRSLDENDISVLLNSDYAFEEAGDVLGNLETLQEDYKNWLKNKGYSSKDSWKHEKTFLSHPIIAKKLKAAFSKKDKLTNQEMSKIEKQLFSMYPVLVKVKKELDDYTGGPILAQKIYKSGKSWTIVVPNYDVRDVYLSLDEVDDLKTYIKESTSNVKMATGGGVETKKIKWKPSKNEKVEGFVSKSFPYSGKGDMLLTKAEFVKKWSPRIESWIGIKPNLSNVETFFPDYSMDFKFLGSDGNSYRIYSPGESAKSKQYIIQKLRSNIQMANGGGVDNIEPEGYKKQDAIKYGKKLVDANLKYIEIRNKIEENYAGLRSEIQDVLNSVLDYYEKKPLKQNLPQEDKIASGRINELSATLLNQIKRYAKENYNEDVLDDTFMLKGEEIDGDFQVEEVSIDTVSGRDIHITIEKLFMKRGGELSKGIRAELEHKKTIDKIYNRKVSISKAPELIAKDHLKEDPKYYSKLEQIEGKKFADGGKIQIGIKYLIGKPEISSSGRFGRKRAIFKTIVVDEQGNKRESEINFAFSGSISKMNLDSYGIRITQKEFDTLFKKNQIKKFADGGTVKFRKLAKSNNFDIIVSEGRFEVELDSNNKVKSIVHPSGERHKASECPIYQKYKKEINSYLTERFKDGGSIGFIPMDLENDLAITAQWGGTNVNGVIGILNAMIDSGITDEDLKPRPDKNTTFQYKKAVEKNIQEIWKKIQPKYKGSFKGNMYYSTIKRLVERSGSGDDILKRFKPFRKNQKDEFFKQTEYKVFNVTDKIYATDENFKTEELAEKFIKEFRKRYEKQGYYRDNEGNKINPNEIGLQVIDSEFNPYSMYGKGGGVGSMDVEIQGFKRNRMGTLSFDLKLSNMRKFQDFIVYPVQKGDDNIKIQSDTRIGTIYMSSGKGEMSQSHSSGAYGVHLAMDKLVPFQLSSEQLEELKSSLRATAGDKVGDYGIVSDNSGADQFANGGEIKELIEEIRFVEKDDTWGSQTEKDEYIKELYNEIDRIKGKAKLNVSKGDRIKTINGEVFYVENPNYSEDYMWVTINKNEKFGYSLPKVDVVDVVSSPNKKFAKGGMLSAEEEKRFQELEEKIDLHLEGKAKVSSKEMVEHAKLKHKKNVATNPEYRKQMNKFRYAEGGNIDSSYLGTTRIGKGHYGWTAKTTTKKQINGYDWEITTMKRSSGDLVSSANGGKSEQKEGYSTFMYSPFEDPSLRLISSKPKMVNEKAVTKQHEEALKIFIEKLNEMKSDKMATGGKVGEKTYNVMHNVGKSKYVVNFHDGEKTYSDGSPFFDIEIFKNLKGLKAFTKKLDSEGYKKQMATGGSLDKIKIGNDDFSFLLKLSDKELTQRLDLVRKQQSINGSQYMDARSKKEDTSKIEGAGERLAKQERAIIEARIRNNKMATGGGVKASEFETKGNTIYINGTKADVKKMYLDYVNNFLTIGSFADHYGISDKQASLIIENGREYAKKDGYYATGGSVGYDADISATKEVIKAFFDKYGDALGLTETEAINKIEAQEYLGRGASSFNFLSVSSNIGDKLKQDQTKPNRGYLIFGSDINPNGVTGKGDIARTYTIDLEIKGRKRISLRSYDNDGRYFKVYAYGRTVDELLDKISTPMLQLLKGMVEKDGLKFSSVKAEGGNIPKVKVGEIITTNTGVKVKVVAYDPLFGGRIKAVRMDEYGDGKESQWIPIKKFKYKDGGNVGKYIYIPNDDISKIVLKSKQVIGKNRILDGAYVKSGKQREKFTDKYKFPIGSVVWDKTHKTYGVVLNNYGDEVFGSHDEIRLDSDGNQNIHTYDKKWNNNGYNLVPYGSEEDKGDGDLTEAKESATRLIEMNSKRKQDAENKKYYEDAYKDLLSGKIDGKPFKVNSEKVIGETSTGKSIYQKYTSMPDLSYEELKEASDIHKKFSKKAKTEEEKQTALRYSSEFMRMANEEKFAKGLGKFATGGNIDKDRLFNFLKDDLEKLKEAINDNDQEEIDKFFSYWNRHLKGLRSESNERMYNFLKDDLEELKEDIEENDQEDIDKFFSYWGQHLEAVKFATGGKITKEDALQEAIDMGVDFDKEFHAQSFGNELTELAKKVGYRKAPSSSGSTGRAFFYHLQKIYDKKKFATGGSVSQYIDGMTEAEILKATIVYDNGGETLDRYTVFAPDGSVYGMSDTASGFNQYVGDDSEIEKGSHLGKRLKTVPKGIKSAVLDRMKEEFADGGMMYAGGGSVNGKYYTLWSDEEETIKTDFDKYEDALSDFKQFENSDQEIELYEIVNGKPKLLKRNNPSNNITYLKLSNSDVVVEIEKRDGKWVEGSVLEGEKPYGWGGKTYMDYLKPNDIVNWLNRDYKSNFQIIEQYAHGGMMYAGGGSTDNKKVYVYSGYSATASEDSYEEGELETAGNWDVNEAKTFTSKKELIDYINKNIIYSDYEETDFDWETGEGRNVQTDVLCSYDDYNGYFPASESEKELWKKGKKKLYNVHYWISVMPVIPTEFKRGGNTNYSYIEKDKIDRIVTNSGKEYGSNVILDGAYVTDRVRTPKMSRTQFEDDVYSYGSGGNLGKSLYVANSSFFDYNTYDTNLITDTLKLIGAKNIRLERERPNFPEVVVFNGDKQKAREALNSAFDTETILIYEKDWRTSKFATGGTVGDYFYDTRKDKAFQVIMEDGDKMAIQYLDRSKSPIGKAETISKNEFEYYVQMGAWNKWKQEFAHGGNLGRKGTYTGRIVTTESGDVMIGKISGYRGSGEPVYDVHKFGELRKDMREKVGELSNNQIKQLLKKYATGGEITPEEREQGLKNYPKLNF